MNNPHSNSSTKLSKGITELFSPMAKRYGLSQLMSGLRQNTHYGGEPQVQRTKRDHSENFFPCDQCDRIDQR